MLVDLLLSKQKHHGAAVRWFLLVLGAPFDARQLHGAAGVWPAINCMCCEVGEF